MIFVVAGEGGARHRYGNIELIDDTFKDQLDLQHHGARTRSRSTSLAP